MKFTRKFSSGSNGSNSPYRHLDESLKSINWWVAGDPYSSLQVENCFEIEV